MIKTITEITKSNQAQTPATCRLVDNQQWVVEGSGTCPNATQQIRLKTEKLKAESILWELWGDVKMKQFWQQKLGNNKVAFRSCSVAFPLSQHNLQLFPSSSFLFLARILAGQASPDVCWTGSSALAAASRASQRTTRLNRKDRKKKHEDAV